ncbi:2-phosphosulfolactate phosphatase [Thermosipho melanesiensis]|uniref:Probable 2-phosphosulfolactate phosphatase n=2 Tax=Thermosipho melanesiensis TaxID=46541 RepID=A6LJZ5_THEM4|nr:2-phosphosulfolactate phosphatase [Thermosipho melanesiensis]ABR30246.1 2-phosphosulfolactate phosphatase [Thermosipho melanesiensis BI429]APT73434.1 2-phosphosulfolactate phosphatase [Thermosipho melanesiensis]OOC37377.1 2-phosphosulfolactate phosphatase [Thermosipho melanesiensis]OOC39739.1 2-phosphosulfolactate phosphatase [Thermosipho melanesiensis]OOC39844.1 2-phosphosulfolactate phosphatase [Thermosipho melanesiensis]
MIDVKFLPEKLKSAQVIVVIDVLRATTTMITAIANGCEYIIPVQSVNDAKVYGKEFLVCGERNGIKPEGFDKGNSPLEYFDVEDKKIVLTTTNGTKTLKMVEGLSDKIILGAFINFSATLNVLKDYSDILFVCAGNDNEISFEDLQVAGAFVDRLFWNLSDSAKALKYMWNALKKPNFSGVHALKLKELGFERDLDFAMSMDLYNIVVEYKDGKVVKGG